MQLYIGTKYWLSFSIMTDNWYQINNDTQQIPTLIIYSSSEVFFLLTILLLC